MAKKERKLIVPTPKNILAIACLYAKSIDVRRAAGLALHYWSANYGTAGKSSYYDYHGTPSQSKAERMKIVHEQSPIAGRYIGDRDNVPGYYRRWTSCYEVKLPDGRQVRIEYSERNLYDKNEIAWSNWNGDVHYKTYGGYAMPRVVVYGKSTSWYKTKSSSMSWTELKKFFLLPRRENHKVKDLNWEMPERYSQLAKAEDEASGWLHRTKYNYKKFKSVTLVRLVTPDHVENDGIRILDPHTDSVINYELD